MREDRLDAPIRPVLEGTGRRRLRFQLVAVAAVTVLVVAAGIGLAGNGFAPEPSHATAAATATEVALASPTRPVATVRPTVGPLPTTGPFLGCPPIQGDELPIVWMGSTLGDAVVAPGIALDGSEPGTATGGTRPPPIGADPTPTTTAGVTAQGWPIPDASHTVTITGAGGLVVSTEPSTCMRSVVAEYVPVQALVEGPFPIPFRALDVAPPSAQVRLGRPPTGEWVLRVVTDFSTHVAGDVDRIAERFFRVKVSSGIVVGPDITPVVPCTPIPDPRVPPELLLEAAGGAIRGAIEPSVDTGLVLTLDRPIEIRTEGDACALAWTIDYSSSSAGFGQLDDHPNPAFNPFEAAQNRWTITDLPIPLDPEARGVDIHAHMVFSQDLQVDRWWHVDVDRPPFPDIRLVGPSGETRRLAIEPCTFSWSTASQVTGSVRCDAGVEVPDGPEPLHLRPGDVVRLVVPDDWVLEGFSGNCGVANPDLTSPVIIVNSCNLGGVIVDGVGIMVPRQSGPVIEVYVNLVKDGMHAFGTLFGSVAFDG